MFPFILYFFNISFIVTRWSWKILHCSPFG